MIPVIPVPAEPAVRYHLRWADRLVPGRVVACYLVGSSALGAFLPERSDLDLVVVLGGSPLPRELARLRALHVVSGSRAAARIVAGRKVALPGTCNAAYVRAEDLRRPVTQIVPVASHVGESFTAGAAFDVNPVVWKELAERGIPVRGPAPSTLGIDPEPHRLAEWNLANLHRYWRPWAISLLDRPRLDARLRPRWTTAWGVLGAARGHRTASAGDVVSKEAAGEHALATFDPEWHPIIREALAYRRGEPADPAFGDRRRRFERTATFVLEAIDAAGRLSPSCPQRPRG